MISLLIVVLSIVNGGFQLRGDFMRVLEEDIIRWAEEYSTNKRIDPLFMLAIAAQESSFRANAISKSGAMGLFQFMPITVKDISERFGYPFDPYNPEQATKAAKIYLTWLCDKLLTENVSTLMFYLRDSNITYPHDLVLIAYNWGYGNLSKYINSRIIIEGNKMIPRSEEVYIELPDETKNYICKVNSYYKLYVFINQ